MNTTLQDRIERELTLKAPIERVFRALTDAGELAKWFPKAIEGRVAPGETAVFDFGEYGKAPVHVVAVEPFSYFAFRWVPGSVPFRGDPLSRPNTLVEFRLEEVEGGTRLRLTESGFASLPAEEHAKSLEENTQGWDSELASLVRFVEGA